jgi:hypothetical protein
MDAPRTLDAVAARTLAGDDGRIAIITRMDGAVVQPDRAGHDDRALLVGGDLAVAPMVVGTAAGAPDPDTLEIHVAPTGGPALGDLVDVRLETADGLWSGTARLDAISAPNTTPAGPDERRTATLRLTAPLEPRARRGQFRYPLPAGFELAAVLWPMAEPAATHGPSDPPFEPRPITPLGIAGQAVEIGGGGAGAVFPTASLGWLEWFDRFMLGIATPGRPETAAVRTTVRVASRRPAGDGHERLGLQFEVSRLSGGTQHAFVYVEIMKLIEAVQAATARRAA